MERGARITLIMKIAGALSERRWQEVDLILGQFDLPTSEYWEGDQYSYVVQHVKDATDERLIELHDWLFPSESLAQRDDATIEEEGNRIWEPGYFRLFISHSSRQADEVGHSAMRCVRTPSQLLSLTPTSIQPTSGGTSSRLHFVPARRWSPT